MSISGIILAAGSGKRTGLKYNKVLYEINGKKVIDYSIDSFKKYTKITELILVVSEEEFEYFSSRYKSKINHIIIGGKERQDSVFKALQKAKNDYVLVHDGARPYLPEHSMKDLLSDLTNHSSLTLGVKVKDTIQEVSGNRVVKTLDRSNLIMVQTPQAFKKDILLKSHLLAQKANFIGTDDTVLLERFMDIKAVVIEGDYRNIKLTTLEDIKILEVIL